jgi:hypothetical protein
MDHEVETQAHEQQSKDKNKSSQQDGDYTRSLVSENSAGCGELKQKLSRTPGRSLLFFRLTRFIDALERLAHAT